jgi:hypothetical protein
MMLTKAPVRSQYNPVHTLPPVLFKINLIILHPGLCLSVVSQILFYFFTMTFYDLVSPMCST